MAASGAATSRLRAACAQQLPRALAELTALCRLRSVSAHGTDMAVAAQAVADLCRGAGGRVRLLERPGGFPAVLARWPGRSPRRLLLYNHYDVQPAEPSPAWQGDPFLPAVRDGRFYARGAADNKGDLVCRLTALRVLQDLEPGGQLPCEVTLLVDGEEEIGSPSLPGYVAAAGDELAADACVWEFGGREPSGAVSLYLGVKGLCYLELRAAGAASDVHSSLAGVVPSAAWRLVWALATLKGPDGAVRVPGFYDGVLPPTAAERAAAARLPFDATELRRLWGLPTLLHEGADDPVSAVLFAPTCNICGLGAGYEGPGGVTVLPATAMAKVDLRLVPRQEPAAVAALVREHLRREGFGDVEVVELGHERPYRTPVDDPFVALVAATAREVYGSEPLIHPTSAGSGPMATVAAGRALPIVSTGCGYWAAQAHGPNENIRLEDFVAGTVHVAHLLRRFGEAGDAR
jgi:acetylornithine deacetylase/succinyl-diaminopimelate desuccinylase-like protein